MAANDPHDNEQEIEQEQERERRNAILFLLILVLGLACLLCAVRSTVGSGRMEEFAANMLSGINPDEQRQPREGRIDPLRPEVLTLPPPELLLTPRGTPALVPTAVVGPLPPETATAQAAAAVPTATPPAPTPTRTPTPTATPTPTPSATPSPTSTATPTPPPTPTPTNTPAPPPPTSPPPTNTPLPTPVPPPSVFSITPNSGVNTAPVSVVIQGANFFGMPTARLGSGYFLSITGATATTLNGTVPAGIPPGVYALTVTNPDAQSGTLSPAYTVLGPPTTGTTLETGYLSTYGSSAPTLLGDDDFAQVLFFEVSATITDSLYFRIFDADTGGGGITETIDTPTGGYDTTVTYALRGGIGAYTGADARSSHPSAAGINSGALLAQTVIGADPAYHDNWGLVFGPYAAGAGEQLVGGSSVFKLAVLGTSGNDGNHYNVALSTSPTTNTMPTGSRVFAYSWTFPLASGVSQYLYPYVMPGTSQFVEYNWDLDSPAGTMTLHTPARDITVPASGISGDGSTASYGASVQAGEEGSTWTVAINFTFAGTWNDLTFWVQDGTGTDMAIFTRPTTGPPP